jgi:hypothetical protein
MRQKLAVLAVCAAAVLGLTLRASEKAPESYQQATKP